MQLSRRQMIIGSCVTLGGGALAAVHTYNKPGTPIEECPDSKTPKNCLEVSPYAVNSKTLAAIQTKLGNDWKKVTLYDAAPNVTNKKVIASMENEKHAGTILLKDLPHGKGHLSRINFLMAPVGSAEYKITGTGHLVSTAQVENLLERYRHDAAKITRGESYDADKLLAKFAAALDKNDPALAIEREREHFHFKS